ncbi:hypothetical protein [Pelagibius sp. Alg239-R121]|uniref:hypothetical protein n=1 Tax=Pelagibius sp. Alg239-R121 TaxID=2993448 RepID=UPI0024A768CB|nr:hypothetical protein [Pelagibius sp. Alg239-R121]
MKTYPSIPTQFQPETAYHVFDKLDGSNIRAEWTAKAGFDRFGTRRLLLSEGDPLAPSRDLILEKYAAALETVFRRDGYQKATCFFEYVGPNSFAGNHPDPLERMDAILFDVNPHRRGILGPKEFLNLFGHLQIPSYIGEHTLDDGFVESVQAGKFEGVTNEGVVCKAVLKNRLKMTKVKSRAWLNRLRTECDSEDEFVRRA